MEWIILLILIATCELWVPPLFAAWLGVSFPKVLVLFIISPYLMLLMMMVVVIPFCLFLQILRRLFGAIGVGIATTIGVILGAGCGYGILQLWHKFFDYGIFYTVGVPVIHPFVGIMALAGGIFCLVISVDDSNFQGKG